MEAAGKVTSVRFLRVNRLIDDLRRERVDQNLSYKYLLGLMIIHNVSMASGSGGFKDSTLFTAIWWLIIVALTVLEVRICYVTNKAGDNRDFVKRYIALSFVVDLIMFAFSLALGLLLTVAIVSALAPFFAMIEVDLTTAVPIVAIGLGVLIRLGVIFWKWNLFAKVSKPITV